MIKWFVFLFIFSSSVFAVDVDGIFSGRISTLNQNAGLVRLKIDFKNMKFLNKRDRVEFWSETNPTNRCSSFVMGKSTDYLLLKVPNFDLCVGRVYLTTGSYLLIESPDLAKNLKIARELVDILVKKQVALDAKLKHNKRDLDTYVEKVEAVNQRYSVLRQKLELEWQKELQHIEEDKNDTFKVYKQTEARLDDVHHKLEQYRVYDQNLEVDRWSLDKNLYIKK